MDRTRNRATDPVIDCAVCVVKDGPRVLITQRRHDDSFGGAWEFPGGKCEPGETLEDCARREAAEEVGIEIEIERRLMTVENPYRDRRINLHFFLCRTRSTSARPIECQDYRWVDIHELSQYLFPPANEPVIAFLIENYSGSRA